MSEFGSALVKAIGRFKWFALGITFVFGVLWWVIDHYAGGHVTDYLDSHSHAVWLWVEGNPVSASMIAGAVFVAFCAFVATRDELIRKFAEFIREPDVPKLELIWRPGEHKFVLHYAMPLEDPVLNVEFRICVVNTSKRTTLTDIRIRLQDLDPYELPCVPCGLRLMNDLPADGESFIHRFTLHPGEEQFVSVIVQKPNATSFWVLHTTPRIAWTIPAQPYTMRIVASCGPTSVSQRFEMKKNGPQWDMRAIDG